MSYYVGRKADILHLVCEMTGVSLRLDWTAGFEFVEQTCVRVLPLCPKITNNPLNLEVPVQHHQVQLMQEFLHFLTQIMTVFHNLLKN